MEYRQFGRSGLKVPVLSFGTATFGGAGNFWGGVGQTGTTEAARLIDVCLNAGITFFDTGDAYTGGASEAILGEALKGKRHQALIAGKAAFRVGEHTERSSLVPGQKRRAQNRRQQPAG